MYKTLIAIKTAEPANSEETCREIIWHNKFIRVDFKTVDYPDWQGKIEYIQDLLHGNRNVMTKEQIDYKYNTNVNTIDLNGIISAIPRKKEKTNT
jgi:phage I-like protein